MKFTTLALCLVFCICWAKDTEWGFRREDDHMICHQRVKKFFKSSHPITHTIVVPSVECPSPRNDNGTITYIKVVENKKLIKCGTVEMRTVPGNEINIGMQTVRIELSSKFCFDYDVYVYGVDGTPTTTTAMPSTE